MRRTDYNSMQDREMQKRGSTLGRCQQCGVCAEICPSGRHGGIDCLSIMHRASVGTLDAAEESTIWLCTVCLSCSEQCPSNAGPAEVIALLREEAAQSGNLPKHFREEAKRYLQTGSCFPHTGMTRKMRRQLGLEDAAPSKEAVEEAREIARRTGLGGLDLD